MRAQEFIKETVNPEVTSDEYTLPSQNVRMGNFVFNARTYTGSITYGQNAKGLQIRAYDPRNLKRSIGSADFVVVKRGGKTWLESDDTEVDPEYRGQGVAAMMYAFAKSLGNDIKDSPYKSMAGADMWKKWGKDAKHLVGEQGVAEAFDQPYKSKFEKSEYGDVDVLTKLPDGTYLSIMFDDEGDGEYQVQFYRNNSQSVTGEGDAQRIFATVLAAIQQFIKKYKPWRLTFSASKDPDEAKNTESRAKLYNRMVQRYAKAWGYEDYAEDHGDQVTYELTQLKPGVAEGVETKVGRRNETRDWAWYSMGKDGKWKYGGDAKTKQQAKAKAQEYSSKQGVAEEQLDELSFLGSECTKDCSGHRAGYEWSKRKGLRQANSWSPSFNKGAGLAVAGK